MDFKEIKKLLIDLDLSQAEIARRIGVNKTYVNHVLKGTKRPEHIRGAIAREMGRTVADLFGEKD